MAQIQHLIVGLGNPGSEYQDTRHNIGFMAMDAIAEHLALPLWKKKFKGLATSSIGEPGFLLLKPLTYMNLSGESVAEAVRFHKLAPKNIVVFHDDLDLAPAQVKIKQGGGTGGHNGLKSLDAHIGPAYWRVRLGIGHPGTSGDVVTNYVLGAFAKADHVWLRSLLEALAADFSRVLEGRMEDYLKQVVHKVLPNPPK